MNTIKILLPIAAALTLLTAFGQIPKLHDSFVEAQEYHDIREEFEGYREAIKEAFQIDIKDFRDKLSGGLADGKTITAYDLTELLAGIQFEMVHTSDPFIALEIAMDHLERIPDYYSRLSRLDRDAMSDKLSQM